MKMKKLIYTRTPQRFIVCREAVNGIKHHCLPLLFQGCKKQKTGSSVSLGPFLFLGHLSKTPSCCGFATYNLQQLVLS
jgi:hypothetical protein